MKDGSLGKSNLFDLTGHTLHFTPKGSQYEIEPGILQWDSDYGPELIGTEVILHNFTFPFSGKHWQSFLIGASGSIRFGVSDSNVDPYGYTDAGIVLGRFDQLTDVGSKLAEKGPAICVFLKPRMSGRRYTKELSDRVVITWDVTEPFGSLLDFSWFKTINQFQVVLHQDGTVEMSYKQVAAKDAIVGIYPLLATGTTPVEVHFSSLSKKNAPFASAYEVFHFLQVPRSQDLACTVIKALGDKFDFLAYYSDFRMDIQEASPVSDGPIGGDVTGIGDTQQPQTQEMKQSRCTEGRFQLGFAYPVYVDSNEVQASPPDGAPVRGGHDITWYTHALAEASPDGKPTPYNYAVGHLGHEVGHRWSAYVAARVEGQTVSLGTWPHWDPGLQAPVPFPYSLSTEASTLGGGVWQDNLDGTFTQLRDGYFVPATGYSYLDLYLMGLISSAEVPDFFVLTNVTRVGRDGNGHQIVRADRKKITIRDIIAAEGTRLPDVDHSQRRFNTGFVIVFEHGYRPSHELIERATGIRQQWIRYWETTTGRRASMTASPH